MGEMFVIPQMQSAQNGKLQMTSAGSVRMGVVGQLKSRENVRWKTKTAAITRLTKRMRQLTA